MNSIMAAIHFALASMFHEGNEAKIRSIFTNRQKGGASLAAEDEGEEGEAEGEEGEEGEEEDEEEEEELGSDEGEALYRDWSKERLLNEVLKINFLSKSTNGAKSGKKKKPSGKEAAQNALIKEHLRQLAESKVTCETRDGPASVLILSKRMLAMLLREKRSRARLRILDWILAIHMDLMRGVLKLVCIDKKFYLVHVGGTGGSLLVSASIPYEQPSMLGEAREGLDMDQMRRANANGALLRQMKLRTSGIPTTGFGRPSHRPATIPLMTKSILQFNPSYDDIMQAAEAGESTEVSLTVGHLVFQLVISAKGVTQVSGGNPLTTYAHIDGTGRQKGLMFASMHPHVGQVILDITKAWLLTIIDEDQLTERFLTKVVDLVFKYVLIAFHSFAAIMCDPDENKDMGARLHASPTAAFGQMTYGPIIKNAFSEDLAMMLTDVASDQEFFKARALATLAPQVLDRDFALSVLELSATTPPVSPPTPAGYDPAEWAPLPLGKVIPGLPIRLVNTVLGGTPMYGLLPNDFSTKDAELTPGVTPLPYNLDPPDDLDIDHEITGLAYSTALQRERQGQALSEHLAVYGPLMAWAAPPMPDGFIWSRLDGELAPARNFSTLPFAVIRILLEDYHKSSDVSKLKKRLNLRGEINNEEVISQIEIQLAPEFSIEPDDPELRTRIREHLQGRYLLFIELPLVERRRQVALLARQVTKALENTKDAEYFTEKLKPPTFNSKVLLELATRPGPVVPVGNGTLQYVPGRTDSFEVLRNPINGLEVKVRRKLPSTVKDIDFAIRGQIKNDDNGENFDTLSEILGLLRGRRALHKVARGKKMEVSHLAYEKGKKDAQAYTDAGELGLDAIKTMIWEIDPLVIDRLNRQKKQNLQNQQKKLEQPKKLEKQNKKRKAHDITASSSLGSTPSP